MSNYPERPMRKGKPKSTHSNSRKGRTWLQAPGSDGKKPKLEEHHIDLSLCKAGHMSPGMSKFLAEHRYSRVPTGKRLKAGPRPFEV